MEKIILNVVDNDSPRKQRSKRRKKKKKSKSPKQRRFGKKTSSPISNNNNNDNEDQKSNTIIVPEAYETLVDLCEKNDVKNIKKILDVDDTLVIACDAENRKTALHIAARHGQLESMKTLIEYGANIKAITFPFQQNILHLLAMHKGDKKKNLECVKYILDNFNHILNINAQDFNGNTCLHWAAQNGNKSMVELLLDRGINKNIRNYDAKHNTAFWSAKKGKHAAIIVMLGLTNENRIAVTYRHKLF